MTTKAFNLDKVKRMTRGYAAAFDKMAKQAWRILSFSLADGAVAPGSGLSISIEKGKLTVVHGVRSFSRIRIRGIKEYACEKDKYPKPESVATALLLARKELKAEKSDVTLCIPGDWTILKTAELPAAVKENLSDVVFYELDRLIPLKQDNARYDFRLLRERGEKLQIVVGAAKQDLVDSYLSVLKEKGVRISRVTNRFSAEGTYFSYIQPQGPCIFVDIDRDGFRGVRAVDRVTEEAFAERFKENDNVLRIQAVVNEIENLSGGNLNADVPPCIFARANDVDSAILSELIPDHFKMIRIPAMEFPPFKNAGAVSFESVGGLLESLWPKSRGMNLLSNGVHRKAGAPITSTVLLATALLATIVFYMMAPLQIEERRIQEIDHQIALRKDEVKRIEALKKDVETLEGEIAAVENFKSKRPSVLNILKEMTLILPKSTWLTRVRIADATVDLEGYAGSATELPLKLETSRYLKKVEFASPTFRDVRLNADRFVMKMEVGNLKKEKGEDAKEE